jgi:hypothetical protein
MLQGVKEGKFGEFGQANSGNSMSARDDLSTIFL